MKRHKNIEDLNYLEMARKRDHKIRITDQAIKKVPRIKYKNIPESEYNTIQELARNVLRISKNENDSNEVAITYGMDSMERIKKGEEYIGVALGSEHGVDPLSNTTAYHLISTAEDCIVIVLHNHPSLSNFSLSDVQFLLRYASVKMMVVITNLGSISYLAKGEGYNYDKAVSLLNEAVALNNKAKNLKGLQKAADHFLKNCNIAGIAYENR